MTFPLARQSQPVMRSVSCVKEDRMKRTMLVFVFGSLCALPSIALAQGAGIEWDTLYEEAKRLYDAGEYERGVTMALKALEVAEQNVGPYHPDVATSLDGLGAICQAQGDYAKAGQLYKRSLAIREKALGPDYPDVARSLERLAALYRATNRSLEAKALEKRAARIRAIKK